MGFGLPARRGGDTLPGARPGGARGRAPARRRVRRDLVLGAARPGTGGGRGGAPPPAPAAGGALAQGDDPLALGAGSHERDRNPQLALHTLDVGASRRRELVVERLLPAGERLVDGPAVVEVALVRRELLRLGPVRKEVADADRDLREGREDVELRQGERRHAVQPHRVAEGDEVEPAATPVASGDGAELAPELAHPLLRRAFDLARERPLAHARDIGLRDADDLVDPRRTDADPGRGSSRQRARGRDEGIRAVVEVEERPVRALEEDRPPLTERAVDEERRVRAVRPEPLRVLLVARGELLELEPWDAVDALEPDVLLGERDLELLAQDLRVEEVLDADPEPHGLVRVGRPDAAFRRADPELAEPALARAVDDDVPRHDHVRVARQADALGRDPARFEVVQLLDEDWRVDDAPGADHALLAPQDPRRHVAQLVGLAVGDDRVAGVRAAVVAADEIGALRQQVDDLALALVAPLGADDHGGGHDG